MGLGNVNVGVGSSMSMHQGLDFNQHHHQHHALAASPIPGTSTPQHYGAHSNALAPGLTHSPGNNSLYSSPASNFFGLPSPSMPVGDVTANRSQASSSRSSWSHGGEAFGQHAGGEVDLGAFASGSVAFGQASSSSQQIGMGAGVGVGVPSSRGYGPGKGQKPRWWEAEELGVRERKVL
jgi:hypothetical protein